MPLPGTGAATAAQQLYTATDGFNVLDWGLASFGLFCLVRGILRGAIREIFGLLGLVLAFSAVAWWSAPFTGWIEAQGLLHGYSASTCAAFVVGVGVYVGVLAAGRTVQSAARLLGLGLFDRLGGGLLGLLRAVLLSTVLLKVFTILMPGAAWIRTSRLAPPLLTVFEVVEPLAFGHKVKWFSALFANTGPGGDPALGGDGRQCT